MGSPAQALWTFPKRLTTRAYPIQSGAQVTHGSQSTIIQIKEFVKNYSVANLYARLRGAIVIAGAGAGVATGRENPEALIRRVNLITDPAFGAITKRQLTARGTILQRRFDLGKAIQLADVPDAAATVNVDIWHPLLFKMPGSRNPIEFSLPAGSFDEMALDVNCGGREELFTGGTNTWNLNGLFIEIWADLDDGVAGKFHLFEEGERTLPVLQSQADLQIDLEKGWIYTGLMVYAERDNVLVNNIVNNLSVYSGSEYWLPLGQNNCLPVGTNEAPLQRLIRDVAVPDPAESLTGVYYIPMLRDGMYTRAADAGQGRTVVEADVIRTSGIEQITVRYRRIKPFLFTV